MNVGGYDVAVDFHVHTSHSFDSITPPRMVIEMARRRGLNGVAVVDHDTISGAVATHDANRYNDFLVIAGVEVKSDRGDVIGLYLQRDIKSRHFADVVAEIIEQGGIAYLPHPVRTFGANALPALHAEHPEIALWERYNGRYGKREFAQADAVFPRMGIERMLCGSDAHFPWEVGVFRTMLRQLPTDPQTLLDASPKAGLYARVRSDVALQSGIRLGALIKACKRRQYAKIGGFIVSLPWRAMRRAVK